MMLRTGNRNVRGFAGSRVRGFTLVEVMVAAAVLALTAVLIYEALFRSLDIATYSSEYLDAMPVADELIWTAQNDLTRFDSLVSMGTSGTFSVNNRNYTWNLGVGTLGHVGKLYTVNLVVNWNTGGKSVRLTRSARTLYRPRDEEETAS